MTLKIGWIGCGTHATQMLLPQLVRHDVRLTVLCDRDAGRLSAAGRQFGVETLTADVRELINHSDIDAVGMAVGPQQHLLFGQMALERGLPVFMEKPPSSTAADARVLRAASEKSGKALLVGFMKRYSVGNKIAANILRSGRFGMIYGMTGHYMTAPGYFTGNIDYNGLLLHHCIHYMDLVSFLISPVKKLTARKVEGERGKILFHVHFDFECGAIATIAMGTMQSRGTAVERLEIMGDHQRLEINNVIDICWHRSPSFKIDDPTAILDDGMDTLSWKPNFTAAANEDPKGYHALLADVVPALMGDETKAPTIMDGVIAMERLEVLKCALAL